MASRLKLLAASLVLSIACKDGGEPKLPPDPREARPVEWLVLEPFGPAPELTSKRRDQLGLLELARLRWRATAPRSYRLVVSQECFCDRGTPFESKVERGAVISAAGGVRSEGRAVEPELRTVEMLFAEADRAIRSNAEEVVVVFDDRFGYPARISVDRWNTLDDEWTWQARLSVAE